MLVPVVTEFADDVAQEPRPRVILLMRHRAPGQFSVETVFSSVVEHLPEDIDARTVVLPRPSQGVFNRLCNIVFTARLRADVIHVTGDVTYCALATRRRACVVTILDLVSLRRLRGWRRQLLWLLWYQLPVWWARQVTTISPAVRRELATLLPGFASKIEVIGCTSVIVASEVDGSSVPRGGRVVLQVGTGPNKNLDVVAVALAGLDVELRIIGRLSIDQVRHLDALGGLYSAAHDLTDDQLIDEYRRAAVLTFTSTYEGFGLPVVEAQSLGLPVITSRTDPMPWVAGDGAVVIDAHDVGAIRRAVESVLVDAQLRENLVAAGRSNARRFEPARVGARYAELYRRLSDRGETRGLTDLHDRLADGWEQRYTRRSFRRREGLVESVLDEIDVEGSRWLDAGCGTGRLAAALARRDAEVVGIDASFEMLSHGRMLSEGSASRGAPVLGDVANLPFPDRSFDGVLCMSVLEYLDVPIHALQEFHRVLRPGGRMIASQANRRSAIRLALRLGYKLANRPEWVVHSRSSASPAEFRQQAHSAGFAVDRSLTFGGPPFAACEHAQLVGALSLIVATSTLIAEEGRCRTLQSSS